MAYIIKHSKLFDQVLEEMSSHGDPDYREVFEAYEAKKKILETNPHANRPKSGLGSIRALDTRQQTRAFYKIHEEEKVVLMIWTNSPEFPHIQSKGELDPCYSKMKSLVYTGKVEDYSPVELPELEVIKNGEIEKGFRIIAHKQGEKKGQLIAQMYNRPSELIVRFNNGDLTLIEKSLILLISEAGESKLSLKVQSIDPDSQFAILEIFRSYGFEEVGGEDEYTLRWVS